MLLRVPGVPAGRVAAAEAGRGSPRSAGGRWGRSPRREVRRARPCGS